jgi:hypothetical protein
VGNVAYAGATYKFIKRIVYRCTEKEVKPHVNEDCIGAIGLKSFWEMK